MKLIVLIISFFLDGIASNIFPMDSFFSSLFTLVSLIIVYPYFDDDYIFYKYSFFTGLAYDLIYTNTFVFYAFIFLLLSFIISKLSTVFADNYLNVVIITLISIIVFRSVTYFLIALTGNIKFNINILLEGIYHSLILNVIYVILLNFVVTGICKKLNIRKSLRY